MRYITESDLRDQFARELPERYALPPDAKLTPAARQYLIDRRLLPLEGTAQRAPIGTTHTGKKPEHKTHLDARTLVRKDHPRIVLRGLLDALEADILLAQVVALGRGQSDSARQLDEALALTQRALACDVKQAPLPAWTLDGMTEADVHDASHHPERLLPSGHPMPTAADGELAARMNQLRTRARQAEIQAVAAYGDQHGACGDSLVLALNRLSSYFYVLQLREIAAHREGHHGS